MSESDAISSSAVGDDRLIPQNHKKCAVSYKRHIVRAAASGDWVEASSYDRTHPNWVSTPLTLDEDTALHIAVSLEQTTFVDKLVERMSKQDMEILNADGNTAFCMAAISGNVEIATILLDNNPRLVWIRGQNGMLPIQLAFSVALPHMVKFLFGITQRDMHSNLFFQDIVRLFFLALTSSIYSVASELSNTYPELASTENEEGLTALEVLAQLSFEEDAPDYHYILRSLFKHMEEEEFLLDSERTSKAMFDTAKSGNMMILEFILQKYNPNLLTRKNSMGQSILHIAILYRQVSVYRLILSKGAYKNAIMQHVDSEGNNVLHLAGKLSAEGRFVSPINHSLIRNEEMWFKEVESIVPPAFRTMRNKEGWTPEELFLKEHKELSESAVSDLNQMANVFLLVATIVETLGTTAGLTIRTNNIQEQTPLFKEETWYIMFLISVAFGVTMAAVSTLLFIATIIRSVWKQKGVGYVSSRLISVICGYVFLCFSIGVMVTFATTSGAVLIYSSFPSWVLYVIAALGGIRVILSYLIYGFSLPLSLVLHLLLAPCELAALRILSTMGIKWRPFYAGHWIR